MNRRVIHKLKVDDLDFPYMVKGGVWPLAIATQPVYQAGKDVERRPMIWVEVDLDLDFVTFELGLFDTGDVIPPGWEHFGTVVMGADYVLHGYWHRLRVPR